MAWWNLERLAARHATTKPPGQYGWLLRGRANLECRGNRRGDLHGSGRCPSPHQRCLRRNTDTYTDCYGNSDGYTVLDAYSDADRYPYANTNDDSYSSHSYANFNRNTKVHSDTQAAAHTVPSAYAVKTKGLDYRPPVFHEETKELGD